MYWEDDWALKNKAQIKNQEVLRALPEVLKYFVEERFADADAEAMQQMTVAKLIKLMKEFDAE